MSYAIGTRVSLIDMTGTVIGYAEPDRAKTMRGELVRVCEFVIVRWDECPARPQRVEVEVLSEA